MTAKGFKANEVISSEDVRNDAIARLVSGLSFADVGGLYNLEGEKCSVAASHGASDVTLIDIIPSDDPLWARFDARMLERGVSHYRKVSSDVVYYHGPKFDVVHSSGVLYHLPNPMAYLRKLQQISREVVIVSSVITPESIENKFGVYKVPGSGVIFVPAISEPEREVLNEFWKPHGCVVGITEKSNFRYDDVGPWWFIPTRKAFISMCETCGMEVLAEGEFAAGDVCVLVLRVKR